MTADNPKDLSLIHDLISQEKEKSALLDKQIQDMLQDVRRLQFQKTQHDNQVKQYQGSITLARRVFPEILASIFEMCVEDGYTRTPLTASHVCSEWRRAARTPSVWSHIYVNLDSRAAPERTMFWLVNARFTPLYITLEIRNDTSHLANIMDLLLKCSSQWISLTINSIFLEQTNHALQLCSHHTFPQLRDVRITVAEEFERFAVIQDEQETSRLVSPRDIFRNTDSLCAFRITRNLLPAPGTLPASITDLSINLPCSQVMATLSISNIVLILEDLPSLRVLFIGMPRGQERRFERERDTTRAVALPTLSSLTLTGSPDLFRLLPHLRASSLRSLTLRSTVNALGSLHTRTGEYLRRFIEFANPALELLDAHEIDLSEADFNAFLPCLPLLKELRLHECDFSDAVLSVLEDQTLMCCPRLQKIDLRWCGMFTGAALVRLVRNRHECATSKTKDGDEAGVMDPISHLSLISCAGVKDTDIFALAEFTVCRVTMRDSDEYCRPIGCCSNDMYRRRLLRDPLLYAIDPTWRKRIIL